MHRPLLLLLLLSPFVCSSGFFRLTLESETLQTVTVRLASEPLSHWFQRVLVPGKEEVFMSENLNFERNYSLLVERVSPGRRRSLVNMKVFPMSESTSMFQPADSSLKFVQIAFKCDSGFNGEKCEIYNGCPPGGCGRGCEPCENDGGVMKSLCKIGLLWTTVCDQLVGL